MVLNHYDREAMDWQQKNYDKIFDSEENSLIAAGGSLPLLIERVIVEKTKKTFFSRILTMGWWSMRRMALLRYSSFTAVGSSFISELR